MRNLTVCLTLGTALLCVAVGCGDGHSEEPPLCDADDCGDAGMESEAGGDPESDAGDPDADSADGDASSPGEDADLDATADGDADVSADGSIAADADVGADADAGADADVGSDAAPDAQLGTPPTAGFTLSVQSGQLPLTVQATSSAAPGSNAIASVRYDFGSGAGFTDASAYRYLTAGDFTVVQKVTDVNGLTNTAMASVHVDDFVPVTFSATDHGASVYLAPGLLKAENRGQFAGGARSNRAVAPGSGVFYFEARRLIASVGVWGVGVATAAAPVESLVSYETKILAQDANSLGITTNGTVLTYTPIAGCSDQVIDSTNDHYGFVIDYRAANPVLYVIAKDWSSAVAVRAICPTTLTDPLYIYYAGVRYEVGYQIAINAGSDLTNFPFYYVPDVVRTALTDAGHADVATALVPGFGQTRSPPPNQPPVIVAPQDRSVPLGTPVQLTARASDPEDGDLTASLTWTDISTQHHAPLTGTGGSFSFTPTVLGRHPIDITARDWDGHEVTTRVMVTVTGTLPQATTVALVPPDQDPLAGSHVQVTGGLQAHFAGPSPKEGVRANQGIYGQYWYFEVHRLIAPGNMGAGLIIGDGSLNPYHFDTVPWSCSANFGGAMISGSTWYNLNSIGTFPQANEYYGFAVDYRGEHPIVHVMVGGLSGSPSGLYVQSISMPDVWVPIYPMLYGDEQMGGGPDVAINFGASPFYLDPVTLLNAQSIDTTGLELGFGDAYTPH